jgi:hypothetical protein
VRLERSAVAAGAGAQQAAGGRLSVLSSAAQASMAGPDSTGPGRVSMHNGYWAGGPAAAVAVLGGLGLALLAGSVLRHSRRLRRRTAALAPLALVAGLGTLPVPAALAVPSWITHQGQVLLDGRPLDGPGFFKFALLDAAGNPLWTHDGSAGPEPAQALQLALTGGHFFAALGRAPQMAPLPAAALRGQDLRLRVWFSETADGPFSQLAPDLELGTVPSALEALSAVNAQSLNGKTEADFAAATHQHPAVDLSSGTLDEARIPSAIARDDEILPAVLAGGGAGSGLDADLLDGQEASAFMAAGTDNWVDAGGDTMSGTLTLPPDGLVAGTDQLVLTGNAVGIGTSSPARKLHVEDEIHSGGPAGGLSFGNRQSGFVAEPSNGERWVWFAADNVARLWSGSDKLTVQPTGEVGIGTQDPGAKLDVAGPIRTDAQLVSTVPTGTAPLAISSTTKVDGLNADLLDGQEASAFMAAGTDNWVDTGGDTMSGTLTLPANGLVAGTDQLVLSGGAVGIGTASPGAPLDISGGSGPTRLHILPGQLDGTPQANAVTLDIPGATGTLRVWDHLSVASNLTVANSVSAALLLISGGAGPTTFSVLPGQLGGTSQPGAVTLDIPGSGRSLRVQDSLSVGESVGIGTSAPERRLHVTDEIHSGGVQAGYSFNNRQTPDFVQTPANGERWTWYASDGVARLWSGSDKLTVDPNGIVQIGSGGPADAEDRFVVSGTGATGVTIRSGAGSSPALRLYRGNNPIGTITSYADSTLNIGTGSGEYNLVLYGGGVGIQMFPETHALEVNGNAYKTTAGGWLTSSDRRLKTDVRPVEHALETIGRLRPVRFRYTEAWRRKHPGIQDRDEYNFIAQEYQEVFPESVQADAEGYLQIDTHPASIVLVRAVQELHQMVRDKEEKIAKLEARLAALEALVQREALARSGR